MIDNGGKAPDQILDVSNLEVTYSLSVAVQGISFTMDRGDILAILGPNGAGKTTTLRAITGFLKSENGRIAHGEVIYNGRNVTGKMPDTIARAGIALVPERDKVFRNLSIDDNLRAVPTRPGARTRDQIVGEIHDLFPILATRRRQLAGYLSGGERQMLAIARALMSGPDLLVCDELSLGISPVLVEMLMQAIVEINRRDSISIILVEQNAAAALTVADWAFIMENGRVAMSGTPKDLEANDDVRRHYLGLDRDHAPAGYGELTVAATGRWFA